MAKRGRKPGRPKTGGRKKGTPNKRTVAERLAAEAAVATPGVTPLAYMLETMRNPAVPPERRDEAARSAAPYLHPKLSAVAVAMPVQPVPVDQAAEIGRITPALPPPEPTDFSGLDRQQGLGLARRLAFAATTKALAEGRSLGDHMSPSFGPRVLAELGLEPVPGPPAVAMPDDSTGHTH